MGIRDRPIAFRSPWQNAYVERLIGSIRRECLDHMIVFGDAHLRRILGACHRKVHHGLPEERASIVKKLLTSRDAALKFRGLEVEAAKLLSLYKTTIADY